MDNLKEKLKIKNYPDSVIDQQFRRAKKKDRRSLIFQQRSPKTKSDDKVRLIFTQNAKNPPLHQWVRESKKLLARNEKAKKIGESIQIVTRQPKNLQRIVTGNNKGDGVAPHPLMLVAISVKSAKLLAQF